MTDLSGITGAVQTGISNTNSSSQTLSADMNTFLTLLTTQLKYQILWIRWIRQNLLTSWFSIPTWNSLFR